MVTNESNATADGLLEAILDTLPPPLNTQFKPIAGLSMLLYDMAVSRLDLDPALVLPSLGFVWGFVWSWKTFLIPLYSFFRKFAQQHFKARIWISNTDEAYDHMMEWLASQSRMANSGSLRMQPPPKGGWEREDNIEPSTSGPYLNFSNQQAEAAPRFVPSLRVEYSFWFCGRYFGLSREQEPRSATAAASARADSEEFLVVSCVGRSSKPIKALLEHARQQYYVRQQGKTTIYCPAEKFMRHFRPWAKAAKRLHRPLETVVLDDKKKTSVLADMNKYLHPKTARWYSNRGIPYRRGYLFSGPPGTGKTSFVLALAALFGLDIYLLSLGNPSITDEDLPKFFTKLPRRCIVLLEDIDASGLGRSKDAASEGSDDGEELKEDGNQHGPRHNKGITLSGLLNAIDGVASHEGRVLIMTSNNPEKLDEALTRPGRVDVKVVFDKATKEQARRLFLRMYEPDDKEGTKEPGGAASRDSNDASRADLARMAEKFASRIPDQKVSPAALQEFMLLRKNNPQSALDEVDSWVGETVGVHEERKKTNKENEDKSPKSPVEAEPAKSESSEPAETKAADQPKAEETKADDKAEEQPVAVSEPAAVEQASPVETQEAAAPAPVEEEKTETAAEPEASPADEAKEDPTPEAASVEAAIPETTETVEEMIGEEKASPKATEKASAPQATAEAKTEDDDGAEER